MLRDSARRKAACARYVSSGRAYVFPGLLMDRARRQTHRMKNTTCSIIALLLFPALPAAARQPEFVRRQLDQPSVVSDVRCAATGRHSADFFPNGALRSCPLASDTTIATHRLSAGTWITIDSLRRLEAAWLEKNTVLAGHTCKGTGYKGFHVRFRPGNGSLFSCYLARDTIIAGVPCLHGSFWTEVRGGSRSVAVFHPEGSLAGCQASREFTLDGVRYPRWTRIARDTSGAISAVARTSRTSATDRDTQMASRHDCGAWKPALLGAVVGGVARLPWPPHGIEMEAHPQRPIPLVAPCFSFPSGSWVPSSAGLRAR